MEPAEGVQRGSQVPLAVSAGTLALTLAIIAVLSDVAIAGAWSGRVLPDGGAPVAAVRAYAVSTLVVSVALAVTGAWLVRAQRSAISGWWLLTAGVLWSINSWGTTTSGIGPFVNWCASTLVWLPIALAIASYPAGAAWPASMRPWSWVAALDFGPLNILLAVVSRPRWNGIAAGAWWPTLLPARHAWVALTAVVGVSYIVIAGWFVAITVARVRSLAPLDRQVLVPVLRGVGAGTGLCAVAAFGQNLALTPQAWVASAFLQSFGVGLLPAVVAVVAVRTLGRRARIASMVEDLAATPTPEAVGSCLSTLMADPTLEVLSWHEGPDGQGGYRDAAGVPRTPPPPGERLVVPVSTRDARPLALVCTDPRNADHRGHLETAVVLARYVLENAHLEVQLRALLDEQVRRAEASRAAVIDAQRALRGRIAGDLHDGLQQLLLGLAARAGALQEAAPTPGLRAEATEVYVGARAAARQVQDISRIVHARTLDTSAERGLRDALDVVADRMPIPVDVRVAAVVADVRLRTVVYRWACQALHAVEHCSTASSASVTVEEEAEGLRVVVRCDAAAAWPDEDAGVTSLRRAASILDGTVDGVRSPTEGATLTARFPARPTSPGAA